MRLSRVLIPLVFVCLLPASVLADVAANGRLSLAGQWRFALDREDAGVRGQWFTRELADSVKLPGSLQEQGFGEEPSSKTPWVSGIGAKLLARPKYASHDGAAGGFKTPFWLTPYRHYVGVAWYQRDVEIPAGWAARRVVLHLERPHWQTSVWIDGQRIGEQDALGTAHNYDVTDAATPGRHRLTVRVDNRVTIPVGLDAHSVSDQTQTDWNGIVGDLSLVATGRVWVDDVRVYPDVAGRKVRVVARLGNRTGQAGEGMLTASAEAYNCDKLIAAPPKEVKVTWDKQGGTAEFEYELGQRAPLWDEFSPALYRLTLELKPGGERRVTTFGLREIVASGPRFLLNGRPIQLRGTLECCIFPLTGYPPTDIESWKRILRVARAHGLNHLRFHSWCPPEAAFVAADEMGFYYQVEASCWANFGDGTAVDRWMPQEAERIVRAYGNHPSFILMVPSNEPGGKRRDAFLAGVIKGWKADPRRLYTAGSGWPRTEENQYEVEQETRLHQSHELNRPPQTVSDYRDYVAAKRGPCVVHEMGQWCVYPNFDEAAKYTGFLKAGNLDIFRDFLNQSGMGAQAHDFFMASGRFQTLLYKAEIEEVLRTPKIGGFQLLDLHDFPGQGTAPVGVLDAFWDSKGYVTPEEYRRFCSQTVPLARLPKRVFTGDETLAADVDVCHFGPEDLKGAGVTWRVRDAAGSVIRQGTLGSQTIPTGALSAVGSIRLLLADLPAPAKLNLEVSIDGTPFANDWDFWVYPAMGNAVTPAGVTIAHDLDDAALAVLKAGGKVLLLPDPNRIAGKTHGAFEPIFWNRITFTAQVNHTLGVLCDPKHPAMARFPTDAHSNWQWWELQEHCKPMILDALPKELTPVVQMIDDWDMCRKLGLAIEARVGGGKLLLCSIDLDTDLDRRVVARQLRESFLAYMASESFAPPVELSAEQVASLLRKPGAMEKLGARVIETDSDETGNEAANVLDGDPATLWHTSWTTVPVPSHPHHVTIRFDSPVTLAGLRLMPRKDGNTNGWIKDYAIYASDDGKSWGDPLARGAFDHSAAAREVRFDRPTPVRFLKVVALSGFAGAPQPYASLASVEPILP